MVSVFDMTNFSASVTDLKKKITILTKWLLSTGCNFIVPNYLPWFSTSTRIPQVCNLQTQTHLAGLNCPHGQGINLSEQWSSSWCSVAGMICYISLACCYLSYANCQSISHQLGSTVHHMRQGKWAANPRGFFLMNVMPHLRCDVTGEGCVQNVWEAWEDQRMKGRRENDGKGWNVPLQSPCYSSFILLTLQPQRIWISWSSTRSWPLLTC
jgi:hypothetical protein